MDDRAASQQREKVDDKGATEKSVFLHEVLLDEARVDSSKPRTQEARLNLGARMYSELLGKLTDEGSTCCPVSGKSEGGG